MTVDAKAAPVLSRGFTLLLSCICALTVGNLYLVQPVLAEVASYFHTDAASAGLVATLAQVGYGFGVLLIVPLGDKVERRALILTLLLLVAGALALSGTAANLPILVAASFLVGVTTVVPQVIMPYAASLAPPKHQASVIGTVQSGLLIGILLARTVAGWVAAAADWRAVYGCATAISLAIAVLVWFRFPRQPVDASLPYSQVLRSMLGLFFKHPPLRKVGMIGALNFAVFSIFWTSLAFFLAAEFHYGPATVGLFGIIGVVGALAASLGGKLSDIRGTAYTQKLSMIVTLVSFMLFSLAGHSLWLLVVGVIVMDMGVQANHISCQAEAFSLDSSARARLNGLYMFMRFLGGALGSLLGAWCWREWQWPGVCGAGVALSAVSFPLYYLLAKPGR